MPFSRFLLVGFKEKVVVDDDSALLIAARIVRLVFDDKDETLAVRGMLSIEDCDEAISYHINM